MDLTGMAAALAAAMGVPSAITGFCFWLLERKIQKREKAEAQEREKRHRIVDEREVARGKYELHIIKSVGAAISLGEATARAVQRIPDAQCNGEMDEALKYAEKVKREQKDFANEQLIKNLMP